jgi:hypothetical protein
MTEDRIPRAQPDALDAALDQLAQSFADLSVIVNAIHQFRSGTTHLHLGLANELRGL